MLTPPRKADATPAALGIVAATIAVTCCAGLPLVGSLLAGLTLAAILALGLGAVLVGALAWLSTAILMRRRQRGRRDGGNEQP